MNINNFLNISELNVSLKGKNILKNLNLNIKLGEVHVIMGPNGAGKSTLARILSGDSDSYSISGKINYNDFNLLTLAPEKRALNGIFLSFQYPIEIPGVSNFQFFKAFINTRRKHAGLNPVDNKDFLMKIKQFMKKLGMKDELLNRSVNENFSGGEKKLNEILQMLLIDPNFIILDEIDSGLDVDALQRIFACINSFFNKNKSLLIITHYSRILDYIDVDFVHVLSDGCIIETGDKSLAKNINLRGFSFLK